MSVFILFRAPLEKAWSTPGFPFLPFLSVLQPFSRPSPGWGATSRARRWPLNTHTHTQSLSMAHVLYTHVFLEQLCARVCCVLACVLRACVCVCVCVCESRALLCVFGGAGVFKSFLLWQGLPEFILWVPQPNTTHTHTHTHTHTLNIEVRDQSSDGQVGENESYLMDSWLGIGSMQALYCASFKVTRPVFS